MFSFIWNGYGVVPSLSSEWFWLCIIILMLLCRRIIAPSIVPFVWQHWREPDRSELSWSSVFFCDLSLHIEKSRTYKALCNVALCCSLLWSQNRGWNCRIGQWPFVKLSLNTINQLGRIFFLASLGTKDAGKVVRNRSLTSKYRTEQFPNGYYVSLVICCFTTLSTEIDWECVDVCKDHVEKKRNLINQNNKNRMEEKK